MPCHFLKLSDFSGETLRYMIDRAKVIKADLKAGKRYEPFAGKVLIMVFEKASTRTRVSFETGFYQLGGNVVNLQSQGSQIGRSESIADTARVISRMGDLIMMRTFGQDRLDDMASNSRVPVINGLTNEYHPCQILTDILTYEEHRGSIAGKTVAWVGDANNMAYTWIEAAKLLGFKLHFSSPEGYNAARGLTSSRPTYGRPWAMRRRTPYVELPLPSGRLMLIRWPSPMRAPSSCTACRRIVAKKSRPMSSTDLSPSSGTRRRIVFTHRRPSWSTACWVVSDKTRRTL